MTIKPELLAPAGNLEKLKVAILYGADAVYLAGQKYGLRARADNFTEAELKAGVKFAHKHGAKVYVTLNAFLHDEDTSGFGEFCQFLEEVRVDAVIASDLGVIRLIRKSSNLKIHLSTQASCLNSFAAKLWKSLGVKRIIVGREVSIKDASLMRDSADIEIEMFVHGAMCMSYSGNCTISNFTAGRDSNRGGCIHSCRFLYEHRPIDNTTSSQIPNIQNAGAPSYFMSSKDLMGAALMGSFFEHRIDSIKIEGRMKSSLYVATICKAYRELIDRYTDGSFGEKSIRKAEEELRTIPHRDYFDGSLLERAGSKSVYRHAPDSSTVSTHKFLAMVVDSNSKFLAIRLFRSLNMRDVIEILPFKGSAVRCEVQSMVSLDGKNLEEARQDTVVCLPRSKELNDIDKLNVVRIAQ